MAYSISASIELSVPSTICNTMGSMWRVPRQGAVGHGQICGCTFIGTPSWACLVGILRGLHNQNTALVDRERLSGKYHRGRTEFLNHGGPVKMKTGRQRGTIIDRRIAEGATEIGGAHAALRLRPGCRGDFGNSRTIDDAETRDAKIDNLDFLLAGIIVTEGLAMRSVE